MKELVVCVSPKKEEFNRIKNLMKSISKKIESKKSLILPPHIILVHRIHTNKYENIKKEIKMLIKSTKPFKLRFDKIGFFKTPPIIFLEPEEKKQIIELHNLLLPKVTKFKDEWVREPFLKLDLGNKQKRYLNKYGSPYVKEFFNAHLTLAGPDVNPQKFEDFIDQSFKMETCFITVDNICLMVKINNKWKIDKRIFLK